MRYGDSIEKAIRVLLENEDRILGRGDPCGLLRGIDEPIGYVEVIPDNFRPFLAWGVDGVHEGLWIDDPNQSHAPYVVMASPMDFVDAVRIETTDVEEFLRLVALGDVGTPEWEAAVPDWERAAARAAEVRKLAGLPPIVGYAT